MGTNRDCFHKEDHRMYHAIGSDCPCRICYECGRELEDWEEECECCDRCHDQDCPGDCEDYEDDKE